jgi:3-oxoacyl-[acyl-carrier-protein] synthase III
VSTPNGGTTLSSGKYGKMKMNGQEVYKFATREVPTVLKEALETGYFFTKPIYELWK